MPLWEESGLKQLVREIMREFPGITETLQKLRNPLNELSKGEVEEVHHLVALLADVESITVGVTMGDRLERRADGSAELAVLRPIEGTILTVCRESAEAAELVKVYENTFRMINIALANELAQV